MIGKVWLRMWRSRESQESLVLIMSLTAAAHTVSKAGILCVVQDFCQGTKALSGFRQVAEGICQHSRSFVQWQFPSLALVDAFPCREEVCHQLCFFGGEGGGDVGVHHCLQLLHRQCLDRNDCHGGLVGLPFLLDGCTVQALGKLDSCSCAHHWSCWCLGGQCSWPFLCLLVSRAFH